MSNKKSLTIISLLTFMSILIEFSISAQQGDEEPPEMGFFVSSVGVGDGANLGGLAGADAHCQALAVAAGGGSRAWQAYLSTQGINAVNARDRIGQGPWANALGAIIANNLTSLHYDNSNITWENAVDENGNRIASRIETPDFSEHDILTGSQIDGSAFPVGQDQTCNNWTSNDEGSARVGHADRWSFLTPGAPWNSSHGTPGCSQEELISVGGAGLLYCFAID
ncbi:MAG: hypothetical protein P8N40_01440 [Gammaproteobacteria bacterium]|nr:hypothetical protein [Gammaproteobacteria bacterium]